MDNLIQNNEPLLYTGNKQCSLTIHSDKEFLEGAFCLWIKSVASFNDKDHCIKSFNGKYFHLKPNFKDKFKANHKYTFTPDMPTLLNQVLVNNEVLHYLCIVATPYNWRENLHIGFIYSEGEKIEKTFKGQKIVLENAKQLYFDDSVAVEKYSHLGKKFTTCRNFQFGAYYFAK